MRPLECSATWRMVVRGVGALGGQEGRVGGHAGQEAQGKGVGGVLGVGRVQKDGHVELLSMGAGGDLRVETRSLGEAAHPEGAHSGAPTVPGRPRGRPYEWFLSIGLRQQALHGRRGGEAPARRR